MPSGGEDDPADDEIQTEIKMERAKSERDIKKQIMQKRAVSQKALLEAKTAQHMGGIHLLADKGQQDAVFSCLAVTGTAGGARWRPGSRWRTQPSLM